MIDPDNPGNQPPPISDLTTLLRHCIAHACEQMTRERDLNNTALPVVITVSLTVTIKQLEGT